MRRTRLSHRSASSLRSDELTAICAPLRQIQCEKIESRGPAAPKLVAGAGGLFFGLFLIQASWEGFRRPNVGDSTMMRTRTERLYR
jgi:hypothetical protein